MSLLCCGGADRDENALPSRPVNINPAPTLKAKTSKTPMITRQFSNQQATYDPSALSTAEEKRRVFGPSGADAAGPSNSNIMSGNAAPPAGPPPGYGDGQHEASSKAPSNNPPPYHNWEDAVPDTALFPPPPVGGYLYSNTGNASEEDAERAHQFCDNTPLWTPATPSEAVYSCVQNFDLRPVKPHEYNGDLKVTGNGRWRGHTRDRNGDCLLLTGLPLYFPAKDSPLITERTKTIYFEVKLLGLYEGTANQTSGFSIGFAAQPYPTWRSPGWERGSVGVFSDDGCRFVNDSWGGREFTTEFKVGETVGLGMTFSLPDMNSITSAQAAGKAPTASVEIFFARDGKLSGSWNLHEEVDEDAGGVGGLEGDFDLYGALGLFGGVKFEVCFDRAGWLWTPPTA
ncbi:hypothetical protein FQN52_007136 [Onygenales sp. PD_12]|nr:hypothetical protein FQN52_007136 [Onygenales sp. PD_12]KAK2804413.1 hypothetical protein FQN51_002055 [Onygenales sp. PD_10]